MILLTEKRRLQAVKALALQAHKGQVDKGGQPYTQHLERVANACKSVPSKIVAYCHDLVEDEHMTLKQLEKTGLFNGHELFCIALLDKKHPFPYVMSPVLYIDGYFPRVKSIPIAREVKIADMKDNMNLFRLIFKPLDIEDIKRYRDYERNLTFLECEE